jgi:hypothetical protein
MAKPHEVKTETPIVIPYVALEFWRLREQVGDHQNMIHISSDHKAVYVFGERIFQSAKLRDRFWVQVGSVTMLLRVSDSRFRIRAIHQNATVKFWKSRPISFSGQGQLIRP